MPLHRNPDKFPSSRVPSYAHHIDAPPRPENPSFPFALIGGLPYQCMARDLKAANSFWRPLPSTASTDGYVMVSWTRPKGLDPDSERVGPASSSRPRRYHARAHQIVWHLHNGPLPEGFEIDHINGLKSDHRIENLRAVVHRDNISYARALQGNWSPSKLTPEHKALVLAPEPASPQALVQIAREADVTVAHLRNLRAVAMGQRTLRVSLAEQALPFKLNAEKAPLSFCVIPGVQHHLVRSANSPKGTTTLHLPVPCYNQADGTYRTSWPTLNGHASCSLARIVWFLSRGSEHPGRIRYRDGNKANLRASNLY